MDIRKGRYTADYTDPLVVFIIGMRINHFHKIGKWLPVAKAMGPMIEELSANPDSGFLGAEQFRQGLRTIMLVQYWRDFECLETYARDREKKHWPAWTAFNKAVGEDGTVGIFHETYVVERHAYETIYANMPPIGLARIAGPTDATGSRNTARSRMKSPID